MSANIFWALRGNVKTQNGMVLLLCLIFLTALTLLGLSASADTILLSKLAANLQEAKIADQSALSSLSWAEKWLLELDAPILETCTEPCDGPHVHTAGDLPTHPEFEDISWWMEHGHQAGFDPLTGNQLATLSTASIAPPVWIIEAVHTIPPAENGTSDLQVWYRLLARGSGRTDTAVSVVESTVVRSWPDPDSTELPSTRSSGPCPGAELTAKCGRVSWRELR